MRPEPAFEQYAWTVMKAAAAHVGGLGGDA